MAGQEKKLSSMCGIMREEQRIFGDQGISKVSVSAEGKGQWSQSPPGGCFPLHSSPSVMHSFPLVPECHSHTRCTPALQGLLDRLVTQSQSRPVPCSWFCLVKVWIFCVWLFSLTCLPKNSCKKNVIKENNFIFIVTQCTAGMDEKNEKVFLWEVRVHFKGKIPF